MSFTFSMMPPGYFINNAVKEVALRYLLKVLGTKLGKGLLFNLFCANHHDKLG